MSRTDVVRVIAGLGLLFAASGALLLASPQGSSMRSSFPWIALCPFELPWLLLLLGFFGLLLLRRWGGILVCAIGWCWVEFPLLLLSLDFWGLSDSEIPPYRDPQFIAVIGTTFGVTVLLTALVSLNWRQLKGGI